MARNTELGKDLLDDEEVFRAVNLYFFRSYKTVKALGLSKNLQFILTHCEDFIDRFFSKLSEELSPEKKPIGIEEDPSKELVDITNLNKPQESSTPKNSTKRASLKNNLQVTNKDLKSKLSKITNNIGTPGLDPSSNPSPGTLPANTNPHSTTQLRRTSKRGSKTSNRPLPKPAPPFIKKCPFFYPPQNLFNPSQVASMLTTLLQLEPYSTFNYILYYNVPFLLAAYLDCSIVQEFLFAVICPDRRLAEINDEMAAKICDYFKQSDFFSELFEAVLRGTPFEMRKFRIAYKPIKMNDMARLKTNQGAGISPSKAQVRYHLAKGSLPIAKGMMVEDQRFIAADIDRVRTNQDKNKLKKKTVDVHTPNGAANAQKLKMFRRSGTINENDQENALFDAIKLNVPINANYQVVFTSPEKLAQIEPFKPKVAQKSPVRTLTVSKSNSSVRRNSFRHRKSDNLPSSGSNHRPSMFLPLPIAKAGSSNRRSLLRPSNLVSGTSKYATQGNQGRNGSSRSIPAPKPFTLLSTERRKQSLNDTLPALTKIPAVYEAKPPVGNSRDLKRDSSFRQNRHGEKSMIKKRLNQSLNRDSSLGKQKNGFKSVEPKLKAVKSRTYSSTMFVPQMLDREKIYLLNDYYPSNPKFAILTELDSLSTKMSFPQDYQAFERLNKRICEFFLETLKRLLDLENSILLKLGVIRRSISPSNMLMALFERNDFVLIENILVYFLLKFPLTTLTKDSSVHVCGEILSLVLKTCSQDNSFLRQYRKKIHSLVNKHIFYTMKLIFTCVTRLDESSVITSSNLKVSFR